MVRTMIRYHEIEAPEDDEPAATSERVGLLSYQYMPTRR